jgi:Polyketide cyclase / dehydrase and lipid transport
VITFETSVRVERPVEEVFAFVSNPLLLPRWNSAVEAVNCTSGTASAVGSTYSMRRELPSGQVENELEVLVSERPSESPSGRHRGRRRFSTATDSPQMVAARSFASRPASSCPEWRACSVRSPPEQSGEASTRTSPPSSEHWRRASRREWRGLMVRARDLITASRH